MAGIWPPHERPQPSDRAIYLGILLGVAIGVVLSAIVVNVWRAVA